MFPWTLVMVLWGFVDVAACACDVPRFMNLTFDLAKPKPQASLELEPVTAFYPQFCRAIVPVRRGFAELIDTATGDKTRIETGAFFALFETPQFVEYNGTLMLAKAHGNFSAACVWTSLVTALGPASQAAWTSPAVCNADARTKASSNVVVLPLYGSGSLPATDFALMHSARSEGSLNGTSLLRRADGTLFANGAIANSGFPAPRRLLRGAQLPAGTVGLFGAYIESGNEQSLFAVSSGGAVAAIGLPSYSALQARGLVGWSSPSDVTEPRLFCRNRTEIVALTVANLYSGQPLWTQSNLTCQQTFRDDGIVTADGDVLLTWQKFENNGYTVFLRLVDAQKGSTLAETRIRTDSLWLVEIAPQTKHILFRVRAVFEPYVAVYDEKLQLVRNITLSASDVARLKAQPSRDYVDLKVNPLTGDKFVTVPQRGIGQYEIWLSPGEPWTKASTMPTATSTTATSLMVSMTPSVAVPTEQPISSSSEIGPSPVSASGVEPSVRAVHAAIAALVAIEILK